jgi:outer membrane lipoprotein-sorting protein
MLKLSRKITPLALLLAMVVAVSGCGLGQQVSAADIIAKMRETMKTTQTVQGVVDLSATINKDGIKALAGTFMGKDAGGTAQGDWSSRLPDTVQTTVKMWKQQPDKARIEVVSSTLPGAKGAVLTFDGNLLSAYDPNGNTVYTGSLDKMEKLPAEVKGMLQNPNAEETLNKLIDASDIKSSGTEKVAGIDAYKLEITPKADAATRLELPQAFATQAGVIIKDLKVTLWVDKDRWIPLKVTVEHPNIGTLTAATSKLELNQPIDASQFVLQVPAGAKTVDLNAVKAQASPKATTLPAARAEATANGWTLLEPSYVPGSATLVEVLSLPQAMLKGVKDASGFILNYSAAGTNFSIVEGKGQFQGMDMMSSLKRAQGAEGMPALGAGTQLKDVSLRGVTAKAFGSADGKWTVLFWQEKESGLWVAVAGGISLDEATRVAEGLK